LPVDDLYVCLSVTAWRRLRLFRAVGRSGSASHGDAVQSRRHRCRQSQVRSSRNRTATAPATGRSRAHSSAILTSYRPGGGETMSPPADGIHTHTHTRLTVLCPGQPGWAGTKKVKPIWILLKQETVSGSGISLAYASLYLSPDR